MRRGPRRPRFWETVKTSPLNKLNSADTEQTNKHHSHATVSGGRVDETAGHLRGHFVKVLVNRFKHSYRSKRERQARGPIGLLPVGFSETDGFNKVL